MHSEGKTYSDILQNIQTMEKPYKLLAFLQKQLPKLKDQSMANALNRTILAMKALKSKAKISQESWCPTEMIEEILPTIQKNSNFWHHSRPPSGSMNWITTYYKKDWNTPMPSLDVIYNGRDHYTIHLNVGIHDSEIEDGIDNLVDMIIKRDNMKIGWNKVIGMKASKSQQSNKIICLDNENEIVSSNTPQKRVCRSNMSPFDSPSR
jgi:hypothetical protein